MMKNLFLGSVMLFGLISFSTAQKKVAPAPATTKAPAKKSAITKPANQATATPPPVIEKTAPDQTVVAKPAVKPVAAMPPKPVTTEGVVLKKDGTPDKRYTAPPAKTNGPLKKDGTPDKRFKANKKP